ncbi:permease-like cell division protein FtsX [Iamia majanohamensis]|uniref:Permease-like cell division protein FtsX n=1 Tax=Iamia majanohamensis TaxID=467976 RepID=A0AAE9Y7X0_9ACTN|nr:permease-like cell division protein FtsX [Iamia majanohamensis]WCO68645.1 permease-like cell division protein FtsX [Iamia majanohamensis]
MDDDALGEALRRHHDDRIPVISRSEVETGTAAGPRRPSRRTLLVAAAAIVVLVAGSMTIGILTRGADDGVTAGPGTDLDAWCTALAAPARVGSPMIVYLTPEADPSDVDDVGARLRSTPGVELARYHDAAAAFAQAKVLFADQPSALEHLREEDLPTSFRVTFTEGGGVDEVARQAEGWPGVQQVERPSSALPPFPDPDGAGPAQRPASGWFGDDRVVDQLRWLAEGGPAEVDASAWTAVGVGTPDDLADAVAALDPLIDVRRPAAVPTNADQASAGALLTAADQRCGLRPRPRVSDDGPSTATTTEPP